MSKEEILDIVMMCYLSFRGLPEGDFISHLRIGKNRHLYMCFEFDTNWNKLFQKIYPNSKKENVNKRKITKVAENVNIAQFECSLVGEEGVKKIKCLSVLLQSEGNVECARFIVI